MAHGQTGSQVGQPKVVRVRLLGGFRVCVGSRTIERTGWRRRSAANLVKILALADGHTLHRDRATDLLWPDLRDEKAQANNLHRALHFARRALVGDASNEVSRYLRLRADLLTLCPDSPLWVDVDAFEEAAATVRRTREPSAYRAAIELYAGELLPEDRHETWAEERRDGLGRLRHALLSELGALHEELGEYEPAIEALGRVVAAEPAQEQAHAALMRLYALSGWRAEALMQYERLREALRRDLDAEPGVASRRLREEIRVGRLPLARPPRSPNMPACPERHNLPSPLTSFVGREREMVEVKRSLSMTRLLTLSGVGGSGKTRLALEVARDLVGVYPDGAWLVELAPLSEPALVPQAVAAALGLRERPGRPVEEALEDRLRGKDLLLLMDNCEHLIDAAAHLAHALLGACPKLRVLGTSREPLGIPGEVVWQVSSLSLPEEDSTIEDLMGSEAVRLFVDRARSRLLGFELEGENAEATARICRKLDGIPLAIELAAARTGALGVGEISVRLEDSLALLAGGGRTPDPRHRTLEAALDWSQALLDDAERTLFRRLSVFAGGWMLEAAEVVGAGSNLESEDVLDHLSRLVDKSMVVAKAAVGGEMRYGLLEPVRQYGRARLEESGESRAVLDRHASFFLALAEKAAPELKGTHQEAWAERIGGEHENMRAALAWVTASGQTESALRLARALEDFWSMRGYLREGRRWLTAALADKVGASATTRARALTTAQFMAFHQGDYKEATELCEEVLAMPRESVDTADLAATLTNLGGVTAFGADYERGLALFEEARPLWRTIGDKVGVVCTLYWPGIVAALRGDHEKARALHEESLPLAREIGDKVGIAWSLVQGSLAALSRGDHEQAEAVGKEGVELTRQARLGHPAVFFLRIMAASAGAQVRPVRSARLWGMAETFGDSIGVIVSPAGQRFFRPYIAAARAQLGEAAFDAAVSEGRSKSPEQAIEYALSEEEPAPGPRGVAIKPLTRREREVALLAGRGMTNARIAAELSISEHTAANHVAKILKKLGLPSRFLLVG